MTIAVGIQCSDGIVFCADRQITDTSGLKYERNKILHKETMPDHASLMLTYSGNPNSAETMFNRLWEARHELGYTNAEKTVKKIFNCKYSKRLKTLIAASRSGGYPRMFRTESEQVYDASVDHIGAGDSSAVRYLAALFLEGKNRPPLLKAKLFGFIFVSAANRYVDGCSGGPDVVTMNQWGHIDVANKNGIKTYRHLASEAERKFSESFDSFPCLQLEGVPLDSLKSSEAQKKSEPIFDRNRGILRRSLHSKADSS